MNTSCSSAHILPEMHLLSNFTYVQEVIESTRRHLSLLCSTITPLHFSKYIHIIILSKHVQAESTMSLSALAQLSGVHISNMYFLVLELDNY